MIWGQRVLFGCLVVVDDRVASFFWKHRLAGLPLVGHSKKSYLYTGLENTVCLFESINGLTALTVSHVKSPGDKYIVLAPSKLKQVELLSSAPQKNFLKVFYPPCPVCSSSTLKHPASLRSQYLLIRIFCC